MQREDIFMYGNPKAQFRLSRFEDLCQVVNVTSDRNRNVDYMLKYRSGTDQSTKENLHGNKEKKIHQDTGLMAS